MCLFFPEVKLEIFKYGSAVKTSKCRSFSKRLEGKSEYEYDDNEVIELDSDSAAGGSRK